MAPSKNAFSKLLSLKNMHNKKRFSLMSIKETFFHKMCKNIRDFYKKIFYNKKVIFFNNNFGICGMIICFTVCLCITKN